MKNEFKRTTAAILAALILASTGAATEAMTGIGSSIVSAATSGASAGTVGLVNEDTTTKAITLTESKTYQLSDDVELNSRIIVPEGVTATLDLNGHTISLAAGAKKATDAKVDENQVIRVEGGTLTITDSSTGGTGKIQGGKWGVIATKNDNGKTGKVIIEKGTITGTTAAVREESGATAEINGGILNGTYGIQVLSGSSATISGTTETTKISGSKWGVDVEGGSSAKITGGAITGTNIGVIGFGADDKITISGGEIKSPATGVKLQNGASVEVTGGTIETTGTANENQAGILGLGNTAKTKITVSGGAVTSFVGVRAENQVTVDITGGTITAKGGYEQSPGGTVTVASALKLLTFTSAPTATVSGTAKLTGEGTFDNCVFIQGCGDASKTPELKVSGNAQLSAASYYAINGNGKTSSYNTKITISGGTVTSGGSAAIYHPQVGDLTITGGSITGTTGIEMRAGTLTVSGASTTITGTANPTKSEANGNGSTTEGAGIAVVQHTTEQPTSATIQGGTIKAYTPLFEENTQKTSDTGIAKVNLSVTGGTFTATNGGTAAVVSEDETGFITGGTFSDTTSAAKYLASGYVISNDGVVSKYTVPTDAGGTDDSTVVEEDGTVVKTESTTDETTGVKTETVTATKTDGSVVKTETTTDADGNVTKTVETANKTNDDGSTVKTETTTNHTEATKVEVVEETAADGTVVTTTTTTSTKENDLSAIIVEEKAEENSKGSTVEQTTTTVIDENGKTTSVTEEHKIENVGNATNAVITIEKDGAGNVQEAIAEVDKTGATKENGLQATFTNKVISQLKEAAGDAAKDLTITMTVKDEDGNEHHSITAKLDDLTPNNTLYIYKQDKNGNYIMVNAKEYTTDKNGQLKTVIKSENDFVMLNSADAAKATKQVLSTVKAAKTTASVKKAKTTTMKLSSGLNMANVKNITYKTSKAGVATVNKNGKITAKKAGKTTVSAVVTLKNGTKKTVKMTITVK
jgi:hypothetical protein